jgi:hypothetical protein
MGKMTTRRRLGLFGSNRAISESLRWLGVAASLLLLASPPARAQSIAGYSEYFIPADETSLQIAFTDLDGPTTDTLMHSVITVTAWSPNTTVYYDHWENGYNFDPNNPATADETYTLATTGAQQVFESSNIPTAPRGTATFYDGGDRIYVAGGTVTVTKASWLEARGAGNQAAAWEIYPVKPQLTTYVIPFGENLAPAANFTPFTRFYTMIQATEDNTTFTVDLNGDGVPDPLNQNRDGDRTDPGDIATVTLNRGQSFLLDRVSACPGGGATCSQANGNILAGTVIQGNKTLQVKFLAGNPGQTYCARGFSAFPRGFWTKDYYAPLDQPTGGGANTDYYLYNPHITALTVNWQTRTGSGSFSIPANGVVSYRNVAGGGPVPVDSGIYFKAADDFWGVGVGDSTGATFEWGFSLLPSTFLYKEHFMGWAPGAIPPAAGGNADNVGVFLTPAQDNTSIFVDTNNDGVVDQTFTLNRLQTQYIFDPNDGDMSRAHIWASGDFTLSYGENADTATGSNPSIDLGYVGIPGTDFVQTVLSVRKTASPQVVPTASGSVATFTIVATTDAYPIDTLSIADVLPANWQFVTDSATITLPNQTTVSGASANPLISGSSLTWDALHGGLTGMADRQTTSIVFQASTTATLAAGTLSRNDVSATGSRVFYSGTPQQITQTFTASDFAFVASGALQISKTSSAPTPAYPGDTFTYTVTATNPAAAGTNVLTGLSLYDGPPPSEVTAVAGSTTLSHSTVGDSFSSQAYNLNVGTRNWIGNWAEANDNNNATSGHIQITTPGAELRLDNSANAATPPRISRAVSLTGATRARLSFRYRTDTGVAAGDIVRIEGGTAGTGGPFPTLIGTITGITGASSGTASFDVSPLISANATISLTFPVGSYTGANAFFYVDDLSITYDVPITGPNPPSLISSSFLYSFAGGESLRATFNVTVNNPFPTGETSITNTASVTARELPLQLTASVTNDVAVPSVQTASVAGRIWQDANGNATQDLGEPGIANVQVTLKDQFGTPLATTLTDSNGRYLFAGVVSGTGYYVEATAPPDPAGAPLSGLTQSAPVGHSDYRTATFTLAAGQNLTGEDQGYQPAAGTAAFGDLAWVDANANGVRDLGEVGLGGVAVRLYRDDGNGLLSTLLDTFVPTPTTVPGSLAVTNGLAAVVGTGTSFLSLGPGDPITIAGVRYTILSITDATHLTLSTNYAGATAAGLSSLGVSTPGAGTVATANGSAAVVGTGTTFTSLAQGDPIEINGVKFKVLSVTDNTHLTLTTNATSTASGLAYGLPVIETTAPDGSYLFTGIAPVGQTYFVVSSLPAGYTRTTGQAFTFTSVASGTAYLNADFGFNSSSPTFSIKDRVFFDANGDASFGGGEAGIANVTVELLDSSLNVVASTITAADGTFSFSGLAGSGADYTTRITDDTGVLTNYYGTTPYAIAGQRLEANLIANVDRSAAPSYGFNIARAVGDTVYNDVNANGTQDSGEPGIAGVSVSLYRDVIKDGIITTAALGTTNVNVTNGSAAVVGTGASGGTRFLIYHTGELFFIAGVPYTIASVTDNTHLTLTTPYAGATANNVAYTGNPQSSVTLAVTGGSPAIVGTGTTFTNYRAGDGITINNGGGGNGTWFAYTILSITDDTHLTLTTNYAGGSNGARPYYGPGDAFLGSVTTDANGQYLFAGLASGGYLTSVTTPAGYTYIPGTRPDSDGSFAGIQLAATIAAGGSVLDRDFGFQANVQRTISGTIWNDINADGVIGGAETRIAGVTVDIVDASSVVIRTLITDASGNYSAAGLPSGTYTVRVTDTLGVLTGYQETFEPDGTLNAQESLNVAGGNALNVNFGFRKPSPTYATIASFAARDDGSQVVVEWTTSSEVGTLGFYLYRVNPTSGRYRQVNDRMLPGLIDSPQGGSYRFVDAGARTGVEITYLLREIEPTGWRDHGPYRVTPAPKASAASISGRYEARPLAQAQAPQKARRERQAQREAVQYSIRRKTGRLLPAAALAPAAATSGLRRAKLAVRQRGLYLLGKDEIATLLGLTPIQVASFIQAGHLRLMHLGQPVAWLPVGGDAMEFYGEPIDSLYTLDNVYWLDAKPGVALPDERGGHPAPIDEVLSFADTVHVEQDRFPATLVAQDPTADYWPWEFVIAGDSTYGTRRFDLQLDGATPAAGTLTVSLLGATDTAVALDHHVLVTVNGTPVGEARWDGLQPSTPSFELPDGLLRDGANSVEVKGVLDSGAPYSIFYVDSFDVACRRLYRAVGDQLLLRAEQNRLVTVTGFDSDRISVVDVSDPQAIRRVSDTTIDQDGTFRVSFRARRGATYLAVAEPALADPAAWPDTPSSLRQSDGADYLVIAPGPLVQAAQALADYRTSRGLQSMVVNLEDVYDEFNDGIASPEALRAFLRYAWKSWPRRPSYVLLAGNGNVDYRNLLGHGDNLVPPLMAATPYGLFASDNRFADVVGRDGVPELAIGRLPVLTAAELTAEVQKIEAYESAAAGPWQQRVLMVADNFDPNAGDFSAESEAVAGLIPSGYGISRAYLDQESQSDVRATLLDSLNQGALLVNYVGHGALDRLAEESLLKTQDVPSLANSSGQPVLAALTCAVGRFDVPGVTPLASALVLDPAGGAIAAWSPTGLSLSDEANKLNQGFARGFFAGGDHVLGHVVHGALADYARPGSQRFMLDIYNLLGDPALELRLP